ncbi:unnamed protein product [Peronospora belbahrii]|uniref:Cell death regulator Aven n=1 Tax=Peronospora belbahrii TaxID=622444 RepID=A0AAU9KTV8_9STRA|nr:unnamed protein product [Peronospora belbahrii]CAH0518886.1 unnamed protein product [Peronospora belbahrii]
MGRSQVKYRTTHGRRGRGRGARNGDAGERTEALKKTRPSHLRNLNSNAYRFEEKEAQDDEQVAVNESQDQRMQFFASEQQYRDKRGSTRDEYYQSRVMKQWEEKDEGANDDGAIGVLDLKWIASQLELVPPDVCYRLDPKYCPQDENDKQCDQLVVATEKPSAAAPAIVLSKPAQGDDVLDFLLNLSASTSSEVKLTPTPLVPLSASSAPTRTATESKQLEDWLDDVLDM